MTTANLLDCEIWRTKEARRKIAKFFWAVPILIGAIGLARSYMMSMERARIIVTMNEKQTAEQALMDSLDHGYAILDSQGRVLEWNAALERWTGWTRTMMLGKTLQPLMSTKHWCDHNKSFKEAIQEKSIDGRTIRINCDINPLDKTKSPIPVEVSVRMVRPAHGEPFCVSFIDQSKNVVKIDVPSTGTQPSAVETIFPIEPDKAPTKL